MQAIHKPEPYALLEYQSSEPRVFAVELRPMERRGLQGILAGLRWIGQSESFRQELTFLVVNLPDRIESHEIDELAECANREGLLEKLCLVVPPHVGRPARTMATLQRSGFAILLGSVGRTCRFGDIADRPVNGVVIDAALLADACGDPHAASILDAVIALANNLGLKSFANECATESEFNFALSAGVSYVAYGREHSEPRAVSPGELRRPTRRNRGSRMPHYDRPS